MKEKKFLSLVIYLHNVEAELKHFLDAVIPIFDTNFEQYEVVCVNDGCQDGTVDLLRRYVEDSNGNAMVNVVHMSGFQGLESSMNAGRDIAIGDFVYEFDDIFIDYEPDMILKVYNKLIAGNDIVAASCKGKRRFTSGIFYALYNKTNRGNGQIGPETFRILSRRAINRIKSMGQYIPYRKAIYANCGLQTATLYYVSQNEKGRLKHKNMITERTTLAFDSFVYFTNVLEKISAAICGFFLFLTIAMVIYIISNVFNPTRPVEGWLSTVGFLTLGFFGVFALLTIILKYLSVMLNLIFKQQRYLVSDVEKVVKR